MIHFVPEIFTPSGFQFFCGREMELAKPGRISVHQIDLYYLKAQSVCLSVSNAPLSSSLATTTTHRCEASEERQLASGNND